MNVPGTLLLTASVILALVCFSGSYAQDTGTEAAAGNPDSAVPVENTEVVEPLQDGSAATPPMTADTLEHIDRSDAAAQSVASSSAPDRGAAFKGFGLSFGLTLFFPGEVNQMISDIYDDMKSGYIISSEFGEPSMFLGESFRLKGMFYLSRYFGLEPFAQAFWSGKLVMVSGAASSSAWVHVLFYSGGLNCWARFNPGKMVAFRAGVGGFGGYSTIEVTGDAGRVSLSGAGYGGNVNAGLELNFGKVAVNIDFTVPIGVINYSSRTGSLSISEPDDYYSPSYYQTSSTYRRYPERIILAGFEFRPGITFKF